MPGVRCEVMWKAWTSVPDVLCEVRSSVFVLPEVCGTLRGMGFCVRYAFVCHVMHEVWSSVICSARGMGFCVRCAFVCHVMREVWSSVICSA